jgi:hypothetical protein
MSNIVDRHALSFASLLTSVSDNKMKAMRHTIIANCSKHTLAEDVTVIKN